MRQIKGIWPALLVLIGGCSGVSRLEVPINPQPDRCQVVEARPSPLSTVPFAICWDSASRPVGIVGGAGTSQAEAATNLLSAGAILGGGALIGQGVSGIGSDIKTKP